MHRASARRARATSWRSFCLIFVKTVNNTITRPGAIHYVTRVCRDPN
jgi:hypothetical protein